MRYPRRRDIAPAGELAGLPARDSPKPSALNLLVCRVESGSILPNLTTGRPYALYPTKKFFSLDRVSSCRGARAIVAGMPSLRVTTNDQQLISYLYVAAGGATRGCRSRWTSGYA